jgi:hypothetical protein
VSICEGETYTVSNSEYTAAGNYLDTLSTLQGCNSIVSTALMVTPLLEPVLEGDTLFCAGGTTTVSRGIHDSYAIQDKAWTSQVAEIIRSLYPMPMVVRPALSSA